MGAPRQPRVFEDTQVVIWIQNAGVEHRKLIEFSWAGTNIANILHCLGWTHMGLVLLMLCCRYCPY